MKKDKFTIDKVGWHTEVENNPESRDHIYWRFRSIITFLQNNGLTIRVILQKNEKISDKFSIESEDLTDEGLELMRFCYDKWLSKVDLGKSPDDLKIFEKKLREMREHKA